MEQAQIEQHLKEIDVEGYTILPNVIDLDLVDELLSEIRRVESSVDTKPKGNTLEGYKDTPNL